MYTHQSYISRRHRNDQNVYLEVVCECNWEAEYGLQPVCIEGKSTTRVSGQDEYITVADAYDIPELRR